MIPQAAQQNNAEAQNKLGILYLKGQGLAQDDVQASTWFSKAAELGDADAQANLAALYQAARGVPRDLIQSYKWYELSQQAGGTDRGGHLSELAGLMSQYDVAEAERMANVWQEVHDENKTQGLDSVQEGMQETSNCSDCFLLPNFP